MRNAYCLRNDCLDGSKKQRTTVEVDKEITKVNFKKHYFMYRVAFIKLIIVEILLVADMLSNYETM